jgi:hypothetical protein
MASRWKWLVATMLAYGIAGGYLFDSAIWGGNHGLSWSRDSAMRVYWAAAVFLISTVWLARRHPSGGPGRIALHAGAAFLAGAVVAWEVADALVGASQHGWDSDDPDEFPARFLYCSCAPRAALLRQTVIAAAVGTIAAAAVSPLVARVARRRA